MVLEYCFTYELFLLIYSNYLTNVAICKNATNNLIDKMVLAVAGRRASPFYTASIFYYF